MEARLPGEGPGGGSAVDEAWRTLRARLSGPLGCLAMLLCFPFALVAFLVVLATAAWRTRGLRRQFREQVAAQRTAAEDEPVLRLVRAMALDESFTREEALQAGVSAASGRTPADLLDEAIRRGWVVDLGGGRLAARPPG
jgi:hypothetical protein